MDREKEDLFVGSLVFVSRYMRPEGLWQLAATIYSFPLFPYPIPDQYPPTQPQGPTVLVGLPLSLLSSTVDKRNIHKGQRESTFSGRPSQPSCEPWGNNKVMMLLCVPDSV